MTIDTSNAHPDGGPTDPPPPGAGGALHDLLPNVRVHLRGGQTIETRCTDITTRKLNNDLMQLGFEGVAPGWPKVHYVRLDSVDAIEWLGAAEEATP